MGMKALIIRVIVNRKTIIINSIIYQKIQKKKSLLIRKLEGPKGNGSIIEKHEAGLPLV